MDDQQQPARPRRTTVTKFKRSQWPDDVVDITWPGEWGNPFIPGHPNGLGWGRVRDDDHAVQLFTRWLYLDHDLVAFERDRHAWILEHLEDLRGKHLACWCALDAPCHGSILLVVANSTTFANRHEDRPSAEGKVDARKILSAALHLARARPRGGDHR